MPGTFGINVREDKTVRVWMDLPNGKRLQHSDREIAGGGEPVLCQADITLPDNMIGDQAVQNIAAYLSSATRAAWNEANSRENRGTRIQTQVSVNDTNGITHTVIVNAGGNPGSKDIQENLLFVLDLVQARADKYLAKLFP